MLTLTATPNPAVTLILNDRRHRSATHSTWLKPGEQVWLTVRWFNPRNQLGPAASPISVRVQQGIPRLCREELQVGDYAKAA